MMTLHEMRWAYVAARSAVLVVLLVLLSMMDASRAVYVFAPSSEHGTLYTARNDDLLVFVKGDGTVFIGSSWVRTRELSAELAWLRTHNPRCRLVLSIHRYAAFADVRNVIRAVREAGYDRFTLDVQPPITLLERRIRARFALPQHDSSRSVTRPDDSGHPAFRLDHMWH